MKSKSVGSLFLVLTLVAGVVAIAPIAFAEKNAQVSMAKATSTPGCEKDNSCFEPAEVKIDVGGTVTWTNDTIEAASHTVTSGDVQSGGPDGKFDSSLMPVGKTFSHTFTDAGTYKYFCQIHPWMTASVVVAAAATAPSGENAPKEAMTMMQGMSSDGSIKITIDTTPATPVSGQPMKIEVTFTDAAGKKIPHINYAITATQDGKQVLSNLKHHEHEGEGYDNTDNLASANPVNVEITILGIGLPDQESSWTGPRGDVVKFNVIPEFGSIATIVLAIAVVSIITVTAKTRVIPKL